MTDKPTEADIEIAEKHVFQQYEIVELAQAIAQARREGALAESQAMFNKTATKASDEFAQELEIRALLKELRAENERLRKALGNIVESWDSQSPKCEEYKTNRYVNGYWSPKASMVESQFISEARAAMSQEGE